MCKCFLHEVSVFLCHILSCNTSVLNVPIILMPCNCIRRHNRKLQRSIHHPQ